MPTARCWRGSRWSTVTSRGGVRVVHVTGDRAMFQAARSCKKEEDQESFAERVPARPPSLSRRAGSVLRRRRRRRAVPRRIRRVAGCFPREVRGGSAASRACRWAGCRPRHPWQGSWRRMLTRWSGLIAVGVPSAARWSLISPTISPTCRPRQGRPGNNTVRRLIGSGYVSIRITRTYTHLRA